MARPRLELHEKLLGIKGVKAAYFHPPEGLKMKFPCITYKLDDWDFTMADNIVYFDKKRYLVTVIDKDPESTIPEVLKDFPMCQFVRPFISDGLSHWVFRIYF